MEISPKKMHIFKVIIDRIQEVGQCDGYTNFVVDWQTVIVYGLIYYILTLSIRKYNIIITVYVHMCVCV